MQIFKEHKIELEAKEDNKLTLYIPVENDIPARTISTSCGCSEVKPGKKHYTLEINKLPLVKYNVLDPEKEFYYYKNIWFSVNDETVTLNIKVTT